MWLRFFGLPQQVKIYIFQEIDKRVQYPVEVNRLLLDPTGAILAQGLTVYQNPTRQRILLQVDQVTIDIDWLNWWRGRGFIDKASVSNAEVNLPIGPGSNVSVGLHHVSADISFNNPDIRIENAQARLSNIVLFMRGTIHNNGFAAGSTPSQDQVHGRELTFQKITKTLDDIGTDKPIELQMEFETSSHDFIGGLANFDLEAHNITWRTAPIQDFELHGSLRDGVITVPDIHANLERGEMTGYGEWNFAEHQAFIDFNSSLDFTCLSPAFQGSTKEILSRLDFPQDPPSISGRIQMNLEKGFKADIQADLDWKDFTFNGISFSHLTIPLAYDGQRLLIPGLSLDSTAGKVDARFFMDKSNPVPDIKVKVVSSLDPTVLKGVFGGGLDNFLNSCHFEEGGPFISATGNSTDLKTDAWLIHGKLSAEKFRYKNADFKLAVSDFSFANAKLDLPNLTVMRNEGTANGRMIYDFKNRSVDLRDFTTQVNVHEVAPVLGPNFTKYTSPYHFTTPPTVTANGIVDLQDGKKDLDTNLVVQIIGHSAMEWTLFSIPYIFDHPQGTLIFKNRNLKVNMKQCNFYEGNLSGEMDLDLRLQPADFVLNLTMEKVDFRKFMIRSFDYKYSKGLFKMQTHLTGAIGQMETLNGTGEVKVSDGDITQIPFLGELTPLIPGFTTADAAHGNFTVAKGSIHTEDLNISSETFALIGWGDYNFIKDRLSLDIRVNANGPFGVFLYPVSKIFEYHGSGPMRDVKWIPKNF